MEVYSDLQNDQHINNLIINHLIGGYVGVCHPITKAYILNLRHIEQMVQNYNAYKERGEIDRYLRAIYYRLKLCPEEVPEENAVI